MQVRENRRGDAVGGDIKHASAHDREMGDSFTCAGEAKRTSVRGDEVKRGSVYGCGAKRAASIGDEAKCVSAHDREIKRVFVPRIRIPAATLAFCVFIALADRTSGAVLTLCAAALHEAGHLAAFSLCGIPVRCVTIYPFGADIIPGEGARSYRQELFIVSAGVAVNLICGGACLVIGSFGWIRTFGVCNIILGCFNCLPVRVFDGGMMLEYMLLRRLSPDRVEAVQKRISFVTLFAIWTWSVAGLLSDRGGISLFLMCVYLFAVIFLGQRK